MQWYYQDRFRRLNSAMGTDATLEQLYFIGKIRFDNGLCVFGIQYYKTDRLAFIFASKCFQC